mmetsp:Transcript_13271/g.30275  ORF Transcript_13271/g.30275 Transcript_13271/m.30275 type:complete len:222 (+) Transcript_13271:362-1027(+)
MLPTVVVATAVLAALFVALLLHRLRLFQVLADLHSQARDPRFVLRQKRHCLKQELDALAVGVISLAQLAAVDQALSLRDEILAALKQLIRTLHVLFCRAPRPFQRWQALRGLSARIELGLELLGLIQVAMDLCFQGQRSLVVTKGRHDLEQELKALVKPLIGFFWIALLTELLALLHQSLAVDDQPPDFRVPGHLCDGVRGVNLLQLARLLLLSPGSPPTS